MRKHRITPIILYLAALVLLCSLIILEQTLVTDVPLNTLVLFYNDECNDCKQIVPVFDNFIKDKNINVTRINVNSAQNHSLCDKYGINELPSIAVFKKTLFPGIIDTNSQTLYTYNEHGQIELNKKAVIELHSLIKKEQTFLGKMQYRLEEMQPIFGLIAMILVIAIFVG